jgi:hypothetical protein
MCSKQSTEAKSKIIRLVFNPLRLNEGQLECSYSKPFQFLYEAVQATKGSNVQILEAIRVEKFELIENINKSGNLGVFVEGRSKWRDQRDLNPQPLP